MEVINKFLKLSVVANTYILSSRAFFHPDKREEEKERKIIEE